jgi:hypothetical protein
MKSILSSLAIPLVTTATMLGTSALFPRPALADRNEIELADAPIAVQEAILDAAAQGEIDGVKRAYRQGQTVYVAEIDLPGKRERHVTVAADGRLMRTKEDVTWAELPAPVRTTLLQQLGRDGTLDDLGRVTVGNTVTFWAEIERPGQQPAASGERKRKGKNELELDVEIAASGKIVSAVESHDD